MTDLEDHWRLSEGVTYLNHGSFGPPPLPVQTAQQELQQRLNSQPMRFFVRECEPLWLAARKRLGEFVGTDESNLLLVDNATYAMNLVANSVSIADGDVLVTDHLYGAVERIWRARLGRDARLVTAEIPLDASCDEEICDALFSRVTDCTRLIVVSHVTSFTAMIFPAKSICQRARRLGVPVCIDGPHAPAHLPLDLDAIDCDYYTASCHKWLSAPFGSGFLYVHPSRQAELRPLVTSWGKVDPQASPSWEDEFKWTGTRDLSANLAIPAAIDFLRDIGLPSFREKSRALARYAAECIAAVTGEPTPLHDSLYGCMALMRAPVDDGPALQEALWRQFDIEVPVTTFRGDNYLRVSCHLYNDAADVERLASALKQLL